MRNLGIGRWTGRPLDKLRWGLLHVILDRLRALNANTRRLVGLLEADWEDLTASLRRRGPRP